MGVHVVPLLTGYGVFLRLQALFSIIICMPILQLPLWSHGGLTIFYYACVEQ